MNQSCAAIETIEYRSTVSLNLLAVKMNIGAEPGTGTRLGSTSKKLFLKVNLHHQQLFIYYLFDKAIAEEVLIAHGMSTIITIQTSAEKNKKIIN